MAEWIEQAAHVGHGIEHSRERAELLLTFVGGAVGGVVAIASGVGIAGVAVGLLTWAGRGQQLGRVIDQMSGKVVEERLGGGLDSVLLGPAQKPAARAHPDSHPDGTRCAQTFHMFEGSATVVAGAERLPLSRRQDRTSCGGLVVEGLDSVLIGGASSGAGIEVAESTSVLLGRTRLVLRGAGLIRSALRNPVGTGYSLSMDLIEAAGEEELADAGRMGKKAYDRYRQLRRFIDPPPAP